MSTVFVHLGVSQDGYMAGPNRGVSTPMGEGAHAIHDWVFEQRTFRQALKLGDGGETGADNALLEHTFARIGANIMGKRMFDEGEASWPEEAPFHNPVFVLTHEQRKPWPRPGGTTFYFVNDDLHTVLAKAREAAGEKDVRISGGGDIVAQYLNAGLVEELRLDLSPVLLGAGLRLFDAVDPQRVKLQLVEVTSSPRVTLLEYSVSSPSTS